MTPLEQKLTFTEFNKQAGWLGQQLVLAQWLERLRWSGLEIVDDEFMTRTRSRRPHVEFNNVLATRIRKSSLNRDLDRCLSVLADEQQASRWFLNAHNHEAEITAQLVERGYEQHTSFSIMAADIALTESLQANPTPPDSTQGISIVNDDWRLQQWVRTLAATYEFSSDFSNTWLDMMLACGTGTENPWRHYLYSIDGQAVGVLSALWTEQVAFIEVLGVLPQFRAQGVGSALIRRALGDAQRGGYKLAVSWPIYPAEAIYQNFGFERLGGIDCVTISPDTVIEKDSGPQETDTAAPTTRRRVGQGLAS